MVHQNISRGLWKQEQINLFICEQYSNMILKNLRVFSQNVWKNKILTNTVLEINKDFNIILIQEPSWSTIWSISSSMSEEDETIIGAPNHLDWVTFARNPSNNNNYPYIILYINICLTSLYFIFKNTYLTIGIFPVFPFSIRAKFSLYLTFILILTNLL